MRFRWRLIAVAALGVASCQRTDSEPSDRSVAGRDPALPGGAAATPAPGPAARCGVDERTTLAGDRIGDLRIGALIDSIRASCRVVRDTVARGTEGAAERRVVVDLGRDSVTAVVDSNRVWRIHVRGPAFRTTDSLGVGTPMRELRRAGARLLTGEGAYFVTLPRHCGLSFRLEGVAFGRARMLAEVPDSARVGEVLVVGCPPGSG